ncbi:hypothetical protein Glove_18g101 [Diversispora epigaea]|uniref:WKF domain-containing protein n=1 Tax=Diversispora epigaea TaxID=1348612 RepID=A0A397JSZ9_9GLOM|nr:hypothetical protein Glove_18g101 [Diversispora epigaea]
MSNSQEFSISQNVKTEKTEKTSRHVPNWKKFLTLQNSIKEEKNNDHQLDKTKNKTKNKKNSNNNNNNNNNNINKVHNVNDTTLNTKEINSNLLNSKKVNSEQQKIDNGGVSNYKSKINERKSKKKSKDDKMSSEKLEKLESLIEKSEITIPKESSIATKTALHYLVEWKFHNSNWKFQKIRQIWLLKHVYDKNMFPDEFFQIFLEYITDMTGHARESTLKEAQNIINEAELNNGSEKRSESESESSIIPTTAQIENENKIKYSRAMEILRILSS